MKNFQPGGLRNRREDIGGRPRGDINKYAPKERREGGKPAFGKSFGDKRSGGFNPKDRAPRETKSYPAICSDCGKACDVPFRPDGVKPVLCRDCYSKKAPATNMSGNRDRFTSNEQRGHTPAPAVAVGEINLITKQLTALEEKVNQILELIKVSEKLATTIPELAEEVVKPKKVTAKKVAKVAVKKVAVKKAPAKKAAVKKVTKKK